MKFVNLLNMELKQVILVRQDLKLSPGKMAAQVAHAAVLCTLKSDKLLVNDWLSSGSKKTILKVKNDAELHKYKNEADQMGLKNQLITDAGRTEIAPGTETCLAIGPELEEKIDRITGDLSMF